MRKTLIAFLLWLVAVPIFGATYNLEIISPQPSLDTNSRWYKAYPGLEYKVPVGVFGGEYPFTYALTTYPSGMTINASTGIITWSNPTTSGSPHNVTVSVTDSESTTVTRSWTITVTTTGFIFLDASAGDGGTGTISSPFNSMVDVYRGTDYASRLDNTYAGYFVYFKNGTYAISATEGYAYDGWKYDWRMQYKPHVWLAYPGHSPVIDLSAGYTIYQVDGAAADLFWHGLRFYNLQSNRQMTMVNNHRHTFFNNTFDTWGAGANGYNSAAIMWYGDNATTGLHNYNFIKDNTFSNMVGGTGNSVLKIYSTAKLVVEGNTINPETSGTSNECVALKADATYSDIRGNTIECRNAVYGNMNRTHYSLIRFNNIKNATEAMRLNNDTTATYIYLTRNTIEGRVNTYLTTGDGPIVFRDNVIVNEDAGTVPAAGSHIVCTNCTDPSILSIASPNLVGYASDGIIDSSGNLQGAYRTTYLDTKGWETTYADTAAPTVSSASVNGSTATINFSESVVSTNYVAGDFNLDCTNPTASNVALSSPSGSGSSRTFSLASPVVYGQTCNLDYLGRTNGIEDAAGNDLASFSDASISNTTPDTTAPTVSDALPTGEQECTSDPRNVTMTVTTSEAATCRYSSSNVAYGSMSNFSTTGGTSHSTIISGLSCGESFTRYVLCADGSANISSPVTTINWSIASSAVPRGVTGVGIIKQGSIH